jgi:hypothetical protein
MPCDRAGPVRLSPTPNPGNISRSTELLGRRRQPNHAIQVRAPAQQLRHPNQLPAASGDAMTVACSMVILAGPCGGHTGGADRRHPRVSNGQVPASKRPGRRLLTTLRRRSGDRPCRALKATVRGSSPRRRTPAHQLRPGVPPGLLACLLCRGAESVTVKWSEKEQGNDHNHQANHRGCGHEHELQNARPATRVVRAGLCTAAPQPPPRRSDLFYGFLTVGRPAGRSRCRRNAAGPKDGLPALKARFGVERTLNRAPGRAGLV